MPLLSVLSAHAIVQSSWYQPDQLTDKAMHLRCSQVDVVAEITHEDGREGVAIKKKQVPALELEKLLEDVRNGIYPLTGEQSHLNGNENSINDLLERWTNISDRFFF